MKIKKLLIRNIRNISEASIPCGTGIHFIHGLNGQGKTSILESVYLLSNLRSFRDSDVSSLLNHREASGKVQGEFELEPGTQAELKVELIRGKHRFEKRAFINQKLSRSSVDYFGLKRNGSPIQFHAIDLNPASTDLIRGDPGTRRTSLNQMVSSENPDYLGILKHYQNSLDQKNALLKEEGQPDPALLEILNENLVSSGAKIVLERLRFLERLHHPLQEFLMKIAPRQAPLNPAYKSGETLYFTGHFELPTLQDLMENLHRKLAEKKTQERLRKVSLVGPHRDDWMFKVGGSGSSEAPDLSGVGSQGEVRSVLLALKLAELQEFERSTGVQPVLLIDDFSSELDSTRRNFLLNFLKDSKLQIFVTSTDDLSRSFESNGTLIRMDQGRVLA